jgi:hypothetical protein
LLKQEDGEFTVRSPVEVRARMIRAAREYERHVAAGLHPEQSAEATAGERLEAELAVDIHDIAEVARAYLEANKK